MKKVAIEDVAPAVTNSPAAIVRLLSPVLDTDGLAINFFEINPSESIGYSYHGTSTKKRYFTSSTV